MYCICGNTLTIREGLSDWLERSDENYMAGRVLWLDFSLVTSCKLLWLSIEQLIKNLCMYYTKINFARYENVLSELENHFKNRYIKSSRGWLKDSINLSLLHDADSLYFDLRDVLDPSD